MAKRTPRTLKAEQARGIRKARLVAMKRLLRGLGDLTDREKKCLAAVRQDIEAGPALRFLAKKARRREEHLIRNFVMAVWGGEVLRAGLGGRRPGDSEPEELLNLAASLFETAETVRKLNGQRYWHPECPSAAVFQENEIQRERIAENFWVQRPKPRAFEETKRAFENLPHTLEMYAKNLRHKVAPEFHSRMRHRREGNIQHRMVGDLLQYIHSLTGRMYRDKVAAILRVINPIAGVAAVEAESLRKRDRRKRGLA